MAEPNEIADSGKAAAPESKFDSTANLPNVESPPLSPAQMSPEQLHEPLLEAQMKVAPTAPLSPPTQPAPRLTASQPMSSANLNAGPRIPHIKVPPLKIPHMNVPLLGISRRNRRRAALAATVVLAAGFGAAVGAVANRGPVQAPPKPDTALIEENHLLQRSVAKLTKDVGALKVSVEASARENRGQIAKVGEQLNEKLAERTRTADITGSVSKPATVAAIAPAPAEKAEAAPMPPPRPAIVQGWTVHEARNGRVIVESRGEFFQIAPGVPLPGLGRVEAIRREGDTVVVVTPKGLITSSQSTAAIRPRPAYQPYYRQY
jgi:hypothetical protein